MMKGLFALAPLALLAACSGHGGGSGGTKDVSGAAIAQGTDGEWLSYGRTYDEQRFSPLTQINADNAGQLGLAWYADLDTNRGQEGTPLVIDGKIYISTAWSKAKAYDAATGKLIWEYDPKVPGETGVKACCDVVNRGLAAWGDKLFLGTLDGRLVAIDRATGKEIWSTVTVDQSKNYTITGAPRVINGMVIIGNGGAEYGVRGYVTAYAADTGKQLWRFYTVPDAPGKNVADYLKKAEATWKGEYWRIGGGGTVWDAMAYDPALDLLYIGVGNGGPWSRQLRSDGKGDNLFLSSIVALRPKTGQYVWHFQTTPGDEWDYTATQSIILADLTIDGKRRKVLMQAPKNGFFYVLDRATGQFISGKPYVTVTWAKGLEPTTGRPIEAEGVRWSENGKAASLYPSPSGGHNWQPMSYSRKTGLAYIPTLESGFNFVPAGADYAFQPAAPNMGIDPLATSLPEDMAIIHQARAGLHGELVAWDPVRQKAAWRVRYPIVWNGGTLVTDGGLVFQGAADGNLIGYDAATGKRLWSLNLGAGIVAPPMSYSVDGEQYLAVAVGYGGGITQVAGAMTTTAKLSGINRLVVLKLNGTATLPPVAERALGTLDPPPATADAATVAAGRAVFARRCYVCHGSAAISGGEAPDLRYSAALRDAASFRAIVRDGALAANGMPGFSTALSAEQTEAVRAYVILRANQDKPRL